MVSDYITTLKSRVVHTLQEFDFIGVVERLDESLVVLMLLVGQGIHPTDILIPKSAKQSSGGSYKYVYNATTNNTTHCVYVPKVNIIDGNPQLNEYVHSEAWYKLNFGDELFYKSVNHNLDLTIRYLNTHYNGIFDIALNYYKELKVFAQERCNNGASSSSTKNACDDDTKDDGGGDDKSNQEQPPLPKAGTNKLKNRKGGGSDNNDDNNNNEKCYWADSGCGYECLDRLVYPPPPPELVAYYNY